MTTGSLPELEAAIVAARTHVDDINKRGAHAGTDVTIEMRFAADGTLANAQRALAAARNEQFAIEIDLGFKPEAAVSGASLIQSENSAVLMFNAMSRRGTQYSPAGLAVVTLLHVPRQHVCVTADVIRRVFAD